MTFNCQNYSNRITIPIIRLIIFQKNVLKYETFVFLSVHHSDPYKKIPPLDPNKLKIFSTVREITGKHIL